MLKVAKFAIKPDKTRGRLYKTKIDRAEQEKLSQLVEARKLKEKTMQNDKEEQEKSLNDLVGEDGDQWQDWLVDKSMDQELKYSHNQEFKQRRDLFEESIHVLNDREKEILYARRLNDEPVTLEELSKKYKISRERIRQIESKAFEKLQKSMLNAAKSKNLLPAN